LVEETFWRFDWPVTLSEPTVVEAMIVVPKVVVETVADSGPCTTRLEVAVRFPTVSEEPVPLTNTRFVRVIGFKTFKVSTLRVAIEAEAMVAVLRVVVPMTLRVPRLLVPETVTLVTDALPKVLWPVTLRLPETLLLVEETFWKFDWPVTLRVPMVEEEILAIPRVVVAVTIKLPENTLSPAFCR